MNSDCPPVALPQVSLSETIIAGYRFILETYFILGICWPMSKKSFSEKTIHRLSKSCKAPE